MTYAGDVDAGTAWQILTETPDAVLIDVRTRPEWMFVGVPDLGALGKSVVFAEWQTLDAGLNPNFPAAVMETVGAGFDGPALFLCRSGARSRDAASALTAHGWTQCFNVADGFEGPPDDHRHRGTVSGWKAAGLPWVQQ